MIVYCLYFREVGMWGVGVGYITAVLTLTVIIAFLGTRGYSRWRITLQMIISLGIGFSIVCKYMYHVLFF